ncbi:MULTISPECIES: hypothetical protein [unclassified Sphingomonas]|uniref:hypothetical protein n=1 Tax=unclassified Sphingomonas TaxID=196159 RepID=UPI00226A712A|nr:MULTISPECIES: hypothetical protein [unclassified Sphingomonas]
MTYVPAESIDLIDLFKADDVEQPALFTSDHDGTRMILAGGQAVFVDGRDRGRALQATSPQTWRGTIISGLSVEIDPCSTTFERPVPSALSLHRTSKSLFLYGVASDRGFSDRISIPLKEGLPASPDHLSAYFTRWRLVLEVRGEAISIVEIDAAKASEA